MLNLYLQTVNYYNLILIVCLLGTKLYKPLKHIMYPVVSYYDFFTPF